MCRVLNMSGFWIFQDCQYARVLNSRVTQGSPIFVNITAFWVCVGIQLRKGSEYFRIPNMPGFCICKCFTKFWICLNMVEYCLNKLLWLWQDSKYAWSKYHRVLKMLSVIYMSGLGIWQVFTYARVTQGAMNEQAWCLNNASICVNVP